MTETIRDINLLISIVGLALSIIIIIQTAVGRDIKRDMKFFFMSFFAVTNLYVICILIRELIYRFSGQGWVAFSLAVLFGQALLASVLTVLVTAFILYQSGEKEWIKSGALRISVLLWMIYAAMEIVNLKNGMFYIVDDANNYSRGSYFAFQMVPPILIMAVNTVTLWMKRDRLTARQKRAFAAYVIIPTMCMVIQIRSLGVHLIALGTVIAAVIMFVNIVVDQREQQLIRNAENAQVKIDILMAQIEPHFLFNSLMTIKHLIGTDPAKADRCLTEFMKYLRQNMDSLTSDRLIPFREELDHVRGYLEIQKIRFEDELDVKYEIEYEDFMIPSLILVPLVENAVTYGIRVNEDRSGTVTIRTSKKDDRVEVIVEDDGPGFVPDELPDDRERSHIGIKNVRDRIESVAGGELMIDSEKGKGTKATIILPLQPEKNEL